MFLARQPFVSQEPTNMQYTQQIAGGVFAGLARMNFEEIRVLDLLNAIDRPFFRERPVFV